MIRPARILAIIFLLLLLCIALVRIRPNYVPQIPSVHELSTTAENDWPDKIWQTWKRPAINLSSEDAERVKTWHDLNPQYRYELLTDASAEAFVRQHFDQEPLIKDTFFALTDNILRADFLRYLVLLAEGGIYTDLDTSCLVPISAWVPPSSSFSPPNTYSAIVGIENDRPPTETDWKLYADYSPYIFRLENWTLSSRRNHPFLRHVALSVARNLIALAQAKGATLEDMQLGYQDVITTTGPIAFTNAFFEYATESTGTEWSYRNLTMLEEPVLVADVVVLPIRAMSVVDANGEGDGAHSWNWPSLVRHHSAGSWKAGHPQVGGEKSPEELRTEGVELPGKQNHPIEPGGTDEQLANISPNRSINVPSLSPALVWRLIEASGYMYELNSLMRGSHRYNSLLENGAGDEA